MEQQINNANITDLKVGDKVIITTIQDKPTATLVSIYKSGSIVKAVTERFVNDSLKTETYYIHNLEPANKKQNIGYSVCKMKNHSVPYGYCEVYKHEFIAIFKSKKKALKYANKKSKKHTYIIEETITDIFDI